MRDTWFGPAARRLTTGSIFTTFGSRQIARTKIAAALAFALSLALPLSGGAAEAIWSQAELMKHLSREDASTVSFTEERRIQHLSEPLLLEGTLSFTPPDLMERVTLRPKRERMTITGRVLSLEKNAKDPPVRVLLSDYPLLEATMTAMRAMLSGDQELLETYFEPLLTGEEFDWTMRLTPRAKEIGNLLANILIRGKFDRIDTIEILETGGDRSTITLDHGP